LANNFIYPSLNNDISADGLMLNILAYLSYISFWGSFVIAALFFINKASYFFSTYLFASDRRIYIKTGFIRVLVSDINFDEIQKIDINYGLLGIFLGYGKLLLDVHFIANLHPPYTYKPENFLKLIHYKNDLDEDRANEKIQSTENQINLIEQKSTQ
jgi:ABC-type antimicrobial peptide transport system permease subunit